MQNIGKRCGLAGLAAMGAFLWACGGGSSAKPPPPPPPPTIYVANSGGISVSTDGGRSFTTGTMEGITDPVGLDVLVVGSRVYAATYEGVWVSADGGASYTSADAAIAERNVNCLWAVGTTVYAGLQGYGVWASAEGGAFSRIWPIIGTGGSARVTDLAIEGQTVAAGTPDGLWVSTDGGTSFSYRTSANSELPNGSVHAVHVSGGVIYAAVRPGGYPLTGGGLAISTDGGVHFAIRTTADGLGANDVLGVYAEGGTVYAGTFAGLSISTDGGAHFENRTTADGLGKNLVPAVFASGSTVYASTTGGLSISTDGGAHFENRTTADGLGADGAWNVAVQ